MTKITDQLKYRRVLQLLIDGLASDGLISMFISQWNIMDEDPLKLDKLAVASDSS